MEFFVSGNSERNRFERDISMFAIRVTRVAEQVDAPDLKSCLTKVGYGFDSRLGYTIFYNAL